MLILGIVILSGIQFLECWGYLSVSKKIKEPISRKGQVSVGILWLVMAALICLNGVAGIKLVNYSEVPLNRALGVIPIAVGFVFSIFVFKSDWKDFHQRFQKKN